jgi:hypothetical protein
VTASSPSGTGPKIAGTLLAVAVLVVLVLLFVVIYKTVTPVFTALLYMGILALVLGLAAYLAQSFSRDPIIQQALGWGLGAMGFVLLFATIWIEPASPALSTATQLEASLVLAILLAVTLVLVFWRVRGVSSTQVREEHRAQWDQSRPPSAFEYAAAHAPGTSGVGSPPSENPPARSP